MNIFSKFKQKTSWAGLAIIVGTITTTSDPFLVLLSSQEFMANIVAGLALIWAPEPAHESDSQ